MKDDLVATSKAAYLADVAALKEHGGYKKITTARQYIEKRLAHLWRPILGIEDEDEALVDQLGFSKTQTLLIHLYGRGVHRHGNERRQIPEMHEYCMIYDVAAEARRRPRAICTNDIARIIGKSQSAVKRSIKSLREHDVLVERRVAYPLFVDSGIMLDLMVAQQSSFGFMYEDYHFAKRVAVDARLADAPTLQKQLSWCDDATRTDGLPHDMSGINDYGVESQRLGN